MKALFPLITAALLSNQSSLVRKSEERGKSDLGWLVSYHTFSFSDYYDQKFIGFSSLRVINEDVVAPGKGFNTHPHKNMEILTYVIEGTLEHKDTMNTHSQITKGEFQLMRAGMGVQHSEYNPSKKEKVHLLQIWIHPDQKDLPPSYEQKSFESHQQGLRLVVSPNGEKGSLSIHQDAKIYLGRFSEKEHLTLSFANRHVWLQMTKGEAIVKGASLTQGDGIAIHQKNPIEIEAKKGAEFLLFDLQ